MDLGSISASVLTFAFFLRLMYGPLVGFRGGSDDKKSACSAVDLGSIPGLGRPPGAGKGYPLQFSGLEDPTDSVVHGVAESQTRLSDFCFLWCAYSKTVRAMPD